MLFLVQREVGLLPYFEYTVVEQDILYGSVFAAVEVWQTQACAVDVVECDIAESCKSSGLFSTYIYIYRAAVDLIHLDVGEGDVFYQCCLSAEIICAFNCLLVWKIAAYCIGCIPDHQVAECAVADHAVVGPADPHPG